MHLQHKVLTVTQGPHRNLLPCFGVLASSRSVRIGPWLRVSAAPCSDDQISNLVAVRARRQAAIWKLMRLGNGAGILRFSTAGQINRSGIVFAIVHVIRTERGLDHDRPRRYLPWLLASWMLFEAWHPFGSQYRSVSPIRAFPQ
jgi:hypothetical protein